MPSARSDGNRGRTPAEIRAALASKRSEVDDSAPRPNELAHAPLPATKKQAAKLKAKARAPGLAAHFVDVVVAPESTPSAQPVKKRPGPPPGAGLSFRIWDRLLELLRNGVFLETAAAAAGVDSDSVRKWLRTGARERERREKGGAPDSTLDELVRFHEEITAALVEAENEAARRVTSAGRYDWKAAAWYLERRAPSRWGQKIGVMVTQELEAFLDALEERLPPDVFDQVLRAADGALASGKASAPGGELEG